MNEKELPTLDDELIESCQPASVGDMTGLIPFAAGEEIKKSDINRYIFQNLANYKLPDQIYLISDMPAILAGKIDKKVLRDWAVNGIPQDK